MSRPGLPGHLHPGELPPFWDRSVVFVANLAALFYGNQGQTARLRREVGHLESYGGRLAPVLDILFKRRENLLLLEAPPCLALLAYFKSELGLTLPEMLVLSHDRYHALTRPAPCEDSRRLSRAHAPWMDGFVTDTLLVQMAGVLGKQTVCTYDGSRAGNNKLRLHEFLCREGFRTFDTERVASIKEIPAALKRLRWRGYERAVLKAQVGASGVGMLRISTHCAGTPGVPEYLFHDGPCLVQGWIESRPDRMEIFSPSVQLFVSEEAVHVYDLTEQLLDDHAVHQGNEAPPGYLDRMHGEVCEKLLKKGRHLGQWLHSLQYRGTASVDFLVTHSDRASDIYVCEINARITGATYPAVLARHFLPRGCWQMRNLLLPEPCLPERVLQAMDQAGSLFRAGDDEGLLPINFNLELDGRVGKGQFLYLGRRSGETGHRMDTLIRQIQLPFVLDRD